MLLAMYLFLGAKKPKANPECRLARNLAWSALVAQVCQIGWGKSAARWGKGVQRGWVFSRPQVPSADPAARQGQVGLRAWVHNQ